MYRKQNRNFSCHNCSIKASLITKGLVRKAAARHKFDFSNKIPTQVHCCYHHTKTKAIKEREWPFLQDRSDQVKNHLALIVFKSFMIMYSR